MTNTVHVYEQRRDNVARLVALVMVDHPGWAEKPWDVRDNMDEAIDAALDHVQRVPADQARAVTKGSGAS